MDGKKDIFTALYDHYKKEDSMQATIQCRELSLKCSGSSRTSVLSISWNKIFMAVPEAIQLWFGAFFFYLQEPNVIVLHLARGSCRDVI